MHLCSNVSVGKQDRPGKAEMSPFSQVKSGQPLPLKPLSSLASRTLLLGRRRLFQPPGANCTFRENIDQREWIELANGLDACRDPGLFKKISSEHQHAQLRMIRQRQRKRWAVGNNRRRTLSCKAGSNS